MTPITPEEMVGRLSIAFVESECAVGGSYCAAWHDWFWSSVEADAKCNDEDRDPAPLSDFAFKIADCHDVQKCALRARAVRAILQKEPGNE